MVFQVAVVGEGSVGKSAFLNAIQGTPFTAGTDSNAWFMSTPAVNVSKSVKEGGRSVALSFREVPGSRGRMPNYHQLQASGKNADCILFCFEGDAEWSLNSLEYTLGHLKRGRSGKLPPLVMLQLKSDLGTLPNASEMAKKHSAVLVTVSAKENTGIDDALEAVARAVSPSKATSTPVAPPAAAAAAPTSTKSLKDDLGAIWGKIVASFTGSVVSSATDDKKTNEDDGAAEDVALVA